MSTSTPTPGPTPPQDAPRFGDPATPADRETARNVDRPATVEHTGHAGHGRGHTWMMLLMCLPMVLLVAALVATGTLGGGAVLYALGCVGMMGAMMLVMSAGHRQ